MEKTAIVWLRRDLRLSDNPALKTAIGENDAVIPVYLLEEPSGQWPTGAASRVWLHQSLEAFSADLEDIGSRLVLRKGASLETISGLISETGATAIYWNRLYDPESIERDTEIRSALEEAGIAVKSFNGALLYEPGKVANKQGNPYRVYTPFWRELERRGMPRQPSDPVSEVPSPEKWPKSLSVANFGLLPDIDWYQGILDSWEPGEKGAHKQLSRFLEEDIEDYGERRDFPGEPATSALSPHLHFGEISPCTIFHEAIARADKVTPYLKQIVWREFSHHLLYHFPETTEQNLNRSFDAFPWQKSKVDLRAWQQGQTGYPIVDAGMRELWHTGWMHNRVRMIVGSFLVKDLLIHWHEGARWFWDTLVDADLANNTMGWQWIAGSGADASPYFRVFNPVTQGEKFDKAGEYVKRWVPELGNVPGKFLHKPWEAPQQVLSDAGVVLGKDYPNPIVDHAQARLRALDAYDQIRKVSG